MLQAKKVSVWKNRYRITADGQPVATWEESMWKVGGQLELAGQHYQIRGNTWGTKYELATKDGLPVAVADRVGRKRWTVQADGRTYQFRRPSMWRQEEELEYEGRRVGSVKRTGVWRGDAAADLPGLALPVQIFVLAVVLNMWDRQAASTAAPG